MVDKFKEKAKKAPAIRSKIKGPMGSKMKVGGMATRPQCKVVCYYGRQA